MCEEEKKIEIIIMHNLKEITTAHNKKVNIKEDSQN